MRKPSIKTITVKNLITFLLIAALILLVIVGLSFRSLSQMIIENKALALSEIIKAGLTSHMKARIMDKRDYFLNEIKSLYEVNQITIIRSPEIINQFGNGLSSEKEPDSSTKKVFKSKQPVFTIDEFNINPNIRAIIPYIASKEGSLNCLQCHEVEDGTVLGAVDIELDITKYRDLSSKVMTWITTLSFIFIVIIVINTFRTIQIYVKEPLESIISKSKLAFLQHKPVDSDKFESLEFEKVAKEINLFNTEILANQSLLEQKNIELIALNDEIEETLKETVFTMGVIEEQRSKETKNHTKRVTEYSRLLALKSGLPEKEIDLVTTASPLHDIGKLGIPDSILLKPGKLTDEEFKTMKNHTHIGYIMLIHSKRDILKAAAIIAHQHHEKWDGSGYPKGLQGEKIHIYGRIVALADVFDALYSKRAYKESWPLEQVIGHIKSERDKHFDPALVDIFLEEVDSFVRIKEQYS